MLSCIHHTVSGDKAVVISSAQPAGLKKLLLTLFHAKVIPIALVQNEVYNLLVQQVQKRFLAARAHEHGEHSGLKVYREVLMVLGAPLIPERAILDAAHKAAPFSPGRSPWTLGAERQA
eukprot:scaffold296866_cov35-Tisochrysis_lutea.AAC.1